ncbi:tRNA-guanine(15) transglycosylase-like protein [Boletus coccyginus]|nr:tRNA-guanine(15) transglycosylase-like protein [Boletus coccyginus]
MPKFSPRVGRVVLTRDAARDAAPTVIAMDTPNILVGTCRGVVPHLSRDHTHASDAIQWLNVPFESFLEQVPPIPTLQNGPHPLHRFLGMPPNGNTYVSANCVRGVKKVTLSDWRKYVYKMQPDVVFALTDTPLTPPPYSQKRITRSIERSATWVADILRPILDDPGSSEPYTPRLSGHPLNAFVHMAGGTSLPAREAFAYGLRETLHGLEADAIKPLRCLDEGITGYVFDLAVLRGIKPSPNTSGHQKMLQHPEHIVEALTPNTTGEASPTSILPMAKPSVVPNIVSLLKASLEELSEQKPRLVTGTRSPHEMLRLIRDVGVDLFDVGWAMSAANFGVALDFVFPVPVSGTVNARQSLGHNLYNSIYAHQFGRLADALVGAGEGTDGVTTQQHVCPCIACSPRSPSSHILHSTVDQQPRAAAGGKVVAQYEKPYSRAYIHHLLHTHEMSAHALLVAHNLAVVSAFLECVRQVWVEGADGSRSARFALEVERFSSAYDESGELFITAKKDWEYVDRARGKGRLTRDMDKQKNGHDE